MGESPKSERPDGEQRSAGTEETPREPGDSAAGNGTVHLRVRDADTRAGDPRLPADLPESSAALAASRPTPQDEDVPESETESTGPQPTMTLRLSDLPEKDEEDEEEDAPAAKPEPTMTLRLSDLPKEEAEAAEAEADGEGVPAPAAKSGATMMLRLSDLPKEKGEAGARDEKAEAGAEADGEGAPAPAAKPEPTMTLRVDKERPEQTVMLRLPKEDPRKPEAKTAPVAPASEAEAKSKPEPRTEPVAKVAKPEPRTEPVAKVAKPEPRTEPVAKVAKSDPRTVPLAAPAAVPAAAAAPVAPAAAEPGPESTIEALEVLKGLSARPVSPLRRALKRVAIWGAFLAVVLGVLVAAQLLRPLPAPKAKLSLTDSFTFGGERPNIPWPTKGQAAAEVVGVGSLGSSGEETPVPIASVTKVMNAYLILQAHPLKKGESGPVITVDQQAAQESGNGDESTVTLKEGQQLTEYEALEMLMLPSANNVARLLARWDSGSEAEFVKKMNATAAQLGMVNTTYADPAGYVNDTKSTAKDQLKLAEKVMQMEIFKQIVAEPDTRFNGQRIYNTNALLGKNGNIGVKTGSSTPAQSCLMWAAVKEIGGEQRMILGVTLGQPQTKEEMSLVRAAQPPSQRINVAAQAALAGQTLARKGDVVGYVDDGVGGRVPLVAAKDLTVAGWNGVTAHLTLTPVGKIAHTLAAGTQVGTLAAGEGEGRVEVPVTLRSDLAPASIGSRLLRLG
ncbi:serine hydrolase [Kitasatospora sp. NPDC001540]|uniref:serine hydrolase n=1 Tax=Kitasatospora sp. NPDC001540 TaxID=3364014 RepID=UPI003681E042